MTNSIWYRTEDVSQKRIKMENFVFTPLPRIHFGVGKVEMLPQEIVRCSQNDRHDQGDSSVLLLVGERSLQANPLWGQLSEKIGDLGLAVHIERVCGEPSPTLVDSIVEKYRQQAIAVVAAIGGGSVLDGGKAVAAMLTMSGSVIDYLEGVGSREPEGTKIPFIAVPTTSGTGSELTCNSVISSVGQNGFKKSLRHPNYMPDTAIIDPALTMDCPLRISGFCAMDGFSQLVESYLSSKASPLTDDLAFGAIARLHGPLRRICQGRADLVDRRAMSYGAAISGITLTNAGLGLIHGFASMIGGFLPIPHGEVCAALLAPCNRVSLEKLQKEKSNEEALGKYARLGRVFSEKEKGNDRYFQDSFIAMLTELIEEVKPAPLSNYITTEVDLGDIARQSTCKNNPIELDVETRFEILRGLL